MMAVGIYSTIVLLLSRCLPLRVKNGLTFYLSKNGKISSSGPGPGWLNELGSWIS